METKASRTNSQRTQSRRQQVLDAAAACFRRSGFRGASMSDISALAGMSTGHIYHYFKSKESIVEAIVERDRQQGVSVIEALKQADDIGQATIDGAIDCLVDPSQFSEPELCLEIWAEASRNPTVARIMDDSRASIRQNLGEVLESGCRQGSVAAGIDIDAACNMLMLLFDGMTVQTALNPGLPREALAQQMRLLMNRILLPTRV